MLNQNDINRLSRNNDIESWKVDSYNKFRVNIIDDRFPCFFATESERKGTSRYLFIGNDEYSMELEKLRDGLYEYLKTYREIGKRTTLVIFFEPPKDFLLAEDYKKQFWDIMQYLHENDPEPWAENIPKDIEHPEWEFCFGGEPIFIVSRAPVYVARKSRYTSTGLEITIQPRGTLEDITEDTKAGKRSRDIIRKKLIEYDEIAPHPDIGDYGSADSREWKQYMLPETNEESIVRCPFTGKLNK